MFSRFVELLIMTLLVLWIFQANLPSHPTELVPQFLVECVFRIESMIDTEGLYRINGDAAVVQKIR